MALDPQTLAALDPAGFVALVQGTSDREIRDDLGGVHRTALLNAIFDRFPQQFRPDRAGVEPLGSNSGSRAGPMAAATRMPWPSPMASAPCRGTPRWNRTSRS